MKPSETTLKDLPGQVQFRDTTVSEDSVIEPDTEVVVTDEVVAVRPLPDAVPESPIEFTVRLDAIRRIRCEGFLCRSISIETTTDQYEIPTMELDELRFRKTLVEQADLTNGCMRLNLDNLGICPCGVGVYTGCIMSVVGFAMILTVVGALLGAVVLAAGLALIGLTYVSRKYGKWRGANIWERERHGTESPA